MTEASSGDGSLLEKAYKRRPLERLLSAALFFIIVYITFYLTNERWDSALLAAFIAAGSWILFLGVRQPYMLLSSSRIDLVGRYEIPLSQVQSWQRRGSQAAIQYDGEIEFLDLRPLPEQGRRHIESLLEDVPNDPKEWPHLQQRLKRRRIREWAIRIGAIAILAYYVGWLDS